MSRITPLMTSLHAGHKAEERIKCIDDMLFNKCEDTKDTILQAFWWYRRNSIPLVQIKMAREEIENEHKFWQEPSKYDAPLVNSARQAKVQSYHHILEILDKLIESEGE